MYGEITLYDVPLALQRVHGYNEERVENGDREDGRKVSGGGRRVDIP